MRTQQQSPTTTTTLRSVSTQYEQILPEACGLVWTDDFFDQEQDIIAVFDFDYESKIDQDISSRKVMYSFFFVWFVLCGTGPAWTITSANSKYWWFFVLVLFFVLYYMLIFMPCMIRSHARWQMESEHVAVTPEGILFVRDRFRSTCILPFLDFGKVSKTIPFDDILFCRIKKPVGSTCFGVTNVLTEVLIGTKSTRHPRNANERTVTIMRNPAVISGLKNPEEFKTLIWAIKDYPGSIVPQP